MNVPTLCAEHARQHTSMWGDQCLHCARGSEGRKGQKSHTGIAGLDRSDRGLPFRCVTSVLQTRVTLTRVGGSGKDEQRSMEISARTWKCLRHQVASRPISGNTRDTRLRARKRADRRVHAFRLAVAIDHYTMQSTRVFSRIYVSTTAF